MALLLIIIAPNGHILANIAIVSQLSLAIDLSSKGLPGQLRFSWKSRSGMNCPAARHSEIRAPRIDRCHGPMAEVCGKKLNQIRLCYSLKSCLIQSKVVARQSTPMKDMAVFS